MTAHADTETTRVTVDIEGIELLPSGTRIEFEDRDMELEGTHYLMSRETVDRINAELEHSRWVRQELLRCHEESVRPERDTDTKWARWLAWGVGVTVGAGAAFWLGYSL